MKAHLFPDAPDTLSDGEEYPGLSDLLEISFVQNRLTTGQALVSPANYGLNSSMMPIDGWRYAPQLDAAAGPAPRDPFIEVYNSTPSGSIQPNLQVPAALMLSYQQEKLQSEGAGPVAYVPGGTATLAGVTTEGQ